MVVPCENEIFLIFFVFSFIHVQFGRILACFFCSLVNSSYFVRIRVLFAIMAVETRSPALCDMIKPLTNNTPN